MTSARSTHDSMKEWAIRLLLAYALLLQGVLGGIAATDHALAASGSVRGEMCRNSADTPSDDAHHGAICCTLGCAAASQPLATPTAALLLPVRSAHQAPASSRADVRSRPPAASGAFNARGPPGAI